MEMITTHIMSSIQYIQQGLAIHAVGSINMTHPMNMHKYPKNSIDVYYVHCYELLIQVSSLDLNAKDYTK